MLEIAVNLGSVLLREFRYKAKMRIELKFQRQSILSALIDLAGVLASTACKCITLHVQDDSFCCCCSIHSLFRVNVLRLLRALKSSCHSFLPAHTTQL